MNDTLVSEENAPFRRILRPLIKALRLAYIQGTNVCKYLPSEKAIQLYLQSTGVRVMTCSGAWTQDTRRGCHASSS